MKISNVLDHTFPEFKPFFNERLSKVAVYLLENYGSAEKKARMNSASYDKLREKVHPHYMSVPSIEPISTAGIYTKYGAISNFSNLGQMLAIAGIEPEIDNSGTKSPSGRMIKHDSSQLRYILLNTYLPLIRFGLTFATYYAKKRAEGKKHRIAITHVAKD